VHRLDQHAAKPLDIDGETNRSVSSVSHQDVGDVVAMSEESDGIAQAQRDGRSIELPAGITCRPAMREDRARVLAAHPFEGADEQRPCLLAVLAARR
jgi:hypothetical protein